MPSVGESTREDCSLQSGSVLQQTCPSYLGNCSHHSPSPGINVGHCFFPPQSSHVWVGSDALLQRQGQENPVTRAMLLIRGQSTGHGATLNQQQRLPGLIGPRTWRAAGLGFGV